MDERIQQILVALADEATRGEQLAGMDDEALAGLIADLRAAAGEAGSDVAVLTSIRDAVNVLKGEQATRAEAAAEAEALAAQAEAEAEAIRAELAADDAGPEDDEDDADAEQENDADEAGAQEAAAPAAPAPAAPQAAAARRPQASLATLAARRPAPQPATRIENVGPRWQLKDGSPAREFSDLRGIAERLMEARSSALETPQGFSQKVVVASLKVDRPEDLEIRPGDDIDVMQSKLEAAGRPALDRRAWSQDQQAIVAAGGWCAPLEPLYEVPVIPTARRPVRDGLPGRGVSRGGVTFVRPARLGTIVTGGPSQAGAAITVWTPAIDENVQSNVKRTQTFACKTPIEEELYAVVARGKFGNLQARAFPEDVRSNVELMMAAHARIAETLLLDALIADIGRDVTQTGVAGTARDVKHYLAQAASEMRYTERTDRATRAIVSEVLFDMIPADVAMQQASGELEALLADEGFARRLLNSIRGFVHSSTLEVPTGADAFVQQGTAQNLADWPDTFEIPLFQDGTAVFLDGGQIDLGIVRDSTLNDTNDYEIFMETFEGLAWLGSYGKTLTLTTCPNGDSNVATDIAGTICSGS